MEIPRGYFQPGVPYTIKRKVGGSFTGNSNYRTLSELAEKTIYIVMMNWVLIKKYGMLQNMKTV